ncbi:hypothetical protein QYF36_013987 [Acer negundo]|nr:hypothetical protein QYF36_013987 [Acer negundo]
MALNLDQKSSLFNFVAQEGNGVKGMVDLGLSTVPAPYIQPEQERIDKQTTRVCTLPPYRLVKAWWRSGTGLLEYLKTSVKIVRKLMEVLLENLGAKLDNAKIDALIRLKMVNMNFYPTCPNPELMVGVGHHSDLGALTVLLQDGIGGLYVKVEEDIENVAKKGEWVEIPSIDGA